MICICHPKQVELLSRFQFLSANVGTGLALPAGLLPASGSLNSAVMNASTALEVASSAGGASSAASSQAAAASALSASPQLQAATQLSALASAASAMSAGLGVDMASPSAGATFASLGSMIPAFINSLAQLPLFLLPKVLEIAQVGELVQEMKDVLDLDLESPQWSDDLGDAIAGKLAEAQKLAEDALKNALAGANELANAAAKAAGAAASSAAALAGLTEIATKDAIAGLSLSTLASVQTGLGIDLLIPGALELLGKKLAVVKSNVAGMPAVLDPAANALILSAMQLLSSIDIIRLTLGIDVLAQGAGASLQSLVNVLGANLGGSAAATTALNGAASSAAALSQSAGGSMSLSGAGAGGAAALGASASPALGVSASPALGVSASAKSGMSASSSAAPAASSPLMNPALAQLMAGMPAMPIPWVLLSALCVQVQSTLGIQLIAHGPCE